MQWAQVRFLVGELRAHKLGSTAEKKINETRETNFKMLFVNLGGGSYKSHSGDTWVNLNIVLDGSSFS